MNHLLTSVENRYNLAQQASVAPPMRASYARRMAGALLVSAAGHVVLLKNFHALPAGALGWGFAAAAMLLYVRGLVLTR